jgi:hypothetical protein
LGLSTGGRVADQARLARFLARQSREHRSQRPVDDWFLSIRKDPDQSSLEERPKLTMAQIRSAATATINE